MQSLRAVWARVSWPGGVAGSQSCYTRQARVVARRVRWRTPRVRCLCSGDARGDAPAPAPDHAGNHGFTHLNEQGTAPRMVDVGGKTVTTRVAKAQSLVVLPRHVLEALSPPGGGELVGPKGPIFTTAVIAGVMAAKRTSDLIPFCHPLPLDKCDIDISVTDEGNVLILATVKVTHRTGVEMEALTAASVAALTVYDMCKALSHDVVITGTQLLQKSGGKRDVAKAAQTAFEAAMP